MPHCCVFSHVVSSLAMVVFTATTSAAANCATDSVIYLFDGSTLSGWTNSEGGAPGQGWEVVDGELHLSVDGPRGGNLLTVDEYQNFILDFTWRISSGGNNGVKYRVRSYDGRTLGCEYQLIDDEGYPEPLRPVQRTGALYDIYGPRFTGLSNRVGEYNHSRIVVCDEHVEHWLNGVCVVSAMVGSDDWARHIAKSKFSDVEEFGLNRTGRIMITDHSDEVWIRSMTLRPLPIGRPSMEAKASHTTQMGHLGNWQWRDRMVKRCCRPVTRRLFGRLRAGRR